jgi:nucleotide-binding universal stress UspA family protein
MSDPRRRKFLVVIDGTPESKVALRYAARRAQATRGIVTLLHVIERDDIQEWAAVERAMREEAQAEAERLLHEHAKVVNDITGAMPELVVREGRAADALMTLLKEDRAISILILAAGTGTEGPGPLVTRVAGPSAGHYPIPVTIVPGSLSDDQVDALTEA